MHALPDPIEPYPGDALNGHHPRRKMPHGEQYLQACIHASSLRPIDGVLGTSGAGNRTRKMAISKNSGSVTFLLQAGLQPPAWRQSAWWPRVDAMRGLDQARPEHPSKKKTRRKAMDCRVKTVKTRHDQAMTKKSASTQVERL
jgi:hypothetical protein